MLTNLENGFKEIGLEKGDIVMVHSSFKSFGKVEFKAEDVIDIIMNIIGKEEGVLIVPTFTFDFCDGFNATDQGYFNIDYPTKMGIISETVRKNNPGWRTRNPIYSVAMQGKLIPDLLEETDKNVFGKDSIFAKLHKLNAKILMIGIDYNNSLTFAHYVEEMLDVPYRYHKKFTGLVEDEYHRLYEDTWTMRVRDLNQGVISNLNRVGEIMEQKGLVKIKKIGESTVKIVTCNDVYDTICTEIKKNPKLLYDVVKI